MTTDSWQVRSSGRVLFARVGALDRLISHHGRPVLPVHSAGELQDLEKQARLFGGHLEQVSGFESHHPEPDSSRGEVIGLGQEVSEPGRLYAWLTRRQWRCTRDVASLKLSPVPTVIITLLEYLTSELFERLFDSGERRYVPGVVFAKTVEDLHRQILLRSASIQYCGSLPVPARIDIDPQEDFACHSSVLRDSYGRLASDQAIRSAVSGGTGLLNLATHSDGVDASLGNQTLCPMDRLPEMADTAGQPNCVLTSFCHRHAQPLAAAQLNGKLVRPEDFRARIFFFQTCFGALLKGARIDPRWSLLLRLWDNPEIGCIVTSWESMVWHPSSVRQLSNGLFSGIPVGASIGSMLDGSDARSLGHRWCCFGDPLLRLTDQGAKTVGNEPTLVAEEDHSDRKIGDLTKLGFLRALLARIPVATEELKAATQAALADIERVERLFWYGRASAGEHATAATEVRGSVLDALCQCPVQPDQLWAFFSHFPRIQDSEKICIGCGSRARTFHSRLNLPGTPVRRTLVCWRCGIVEDTPAQFVDWQPDWEGPQAIRLQGRIPDSPWTARVRIIDPAGNFNTLAWPQTPSGGMSQRCELEKPLRLRERVQVYLVCEFDFSVMTIPRLGKLTTGA